MAREYVRVCFGMSKQGVRLGGEDGFISGRFEVIYVSASHTILMFAYGFPTVVT